MQMLLCQRKCDRYHKKFQRNCAIVAKKKVIESLNQGTSYSYCIGGYKAHTS